VKYMLSAPLQSVYHRSYPETVPGKHLSFMLNHPVWSWMLLLHKCLFTDYCWRKWNLQSNVICSFLCKFWKSYNKLCAMVTRNFMDARHMQLISVFTIKENCTPWQASCLM